MSNRNSDIFAMGCASYLLGALGLLLLLVGCIIGGGGKILGFLLVLAFWGIAACLQAKKQTKARPLNLDDFSVDYSPRGNRNPPRRGFGPQAHCDYFPRLNSLNPNTRYSGKMLCFTGVATEDKARLNAIAAELHCRIRFSVSPKIDFLICGPEAGPAKIAQARQLNIPIVHIEGFFQEITKPVKLK